MTQLLENYPQGTGCVCPICGTSEDEITMLVPLHDKTEEVSNEAVPVHVECILNNIQYSNAHKLMGLETIE